MSKNSRIFEFIMEWRILSKVKAKEFKSLASKKERELKGLFLAEGDKCVKDMLEAFSPEALIVTSKWVEDNEELAEKYQDRVLITDKRGIEIISSLKSLPEVIAVFRKPEEQPGIPQLDDNKLYLLLDEIQDPGNLGTIIRTCDWFGVYDIYASPDTADVFGPKVVQSTMGSLSRVRVHYIDLKDLINRNKNLRLYGTLLEGTSYEEVKLESGMLLMGNEGRGISDDLKILIDTGITIPPANKISHPDSLNVAIATAVVLSRHKINQA